VGTGNYRRCIAPGPQADVDFGVKCGEGKVRQVLALMHIDQRLRLL
jgi:hypothetical protein